jgi:hypothetical protein
MHRVRLLTHIIRLLLTIIPSERGYGLKEEGTSCDLGITPLLDDVPLPTQHAARCKVS